MELHEMIVSKRAKNPFLRNVDLAYDLFLELLISGKLKPEDKILQDAYAKKFEMSRTPVREALLRLEKERFLRSSERCGFIVCPIYYSDFCELSKFRGILEEGAAKIAIRNFDDLQIEKMKENVIRSKRFRGPCAQEEERIRFLDLDFEFHSMIIYGSSNRYLIESYENIIPRLYFYQRMVHTKMYNFAYVSGTHEQIYRAFLNRDEGKVLQTLREHCEFYTKRSIQEIFEK